MVRGDAREKVDSDLDAGVTGNQKKHGVTEHIISTRAYLSTCRSSNTLGRVAPKRLARSLSGCIVLVLIELLTSRVR